MSNPFGKMFDVFVNSAINSFIEKAGDNITPTQQNYIDVIKSRDPSKGVPLATNLYNSMGETKDQAISKASNFFHI